MTALNAEVKATLRDCGITTAGWARAQHFADGRWGGDACGCPDDRCTGYHHDEDADCGCFSVLLTTELQRRAAGTRLTDLEAAFPDWSIFPDGAGWWHARLITAPEGEPVRVSADTVEDLAAELNNYVAGDGPQ